MLPISLQKTGLVFKPLTGDAYYYLFESINVRAENYGGLYIRVKREKVHPSILLWHFCSSSEM